MDNIRVGDRIKFRAVTRHSDRAVTRVVNGFVSENGNPTVRFHGWGNFVVRRHEIHEVIPQACARHYEDNQGLCHACGMPMNIDGWYAYAGYNDKARDQWDAMIKKWEVGHGTR